MMIEHGKFQASPLDFEWFRAKPSQYFRKKISDDITVIEDLDIKMEKSEWWEEFQGGLRRVQIL